MIVYRETMASSLLAVADTDSFDSVPPQNELRIDHGVRRNSTGYSFELRQLDLRVQHSSDSTFAPAPLSVIRRSSTGGKKHSVSSAPVLGKYFNRRSVDENHQSHFSVGHRECAADLRHR